MFQTWPDVIWECTLVRVWGGIGVCSWGRCACATVNTGYRRPQYTQRDVHTNFSHAHFYIKHNLLYKMTISLHIMRLLPLSQDFKKIFSRNYFFNKCSKMEFLIFPFYFRFLKKIMFCLQYYSGVVFFSCCLFRKYSFDVLV